MKRLLLFLLLAARCVFGGAPAGYVQVFSDDFNGTALSSAWTNPGIYWETAGLPANIKVANGELTLSWTAGQPTVDTSVRTQTANAWRYGYFAARMKWNPVLGAWPAFWLLPTQGFPGGSKDTGELDMFEGQGALPLTYFGTLHEWLNGVDTQNNTGGGANAHTLPAGTDVSQYHVYSCEWTPNSISWYFDGLLVGSMVPYDVFGTENMYLILSSQVGVNWQPGNVTGVTATKLDVTFDWVRVWQK